MPLFTSGFFMFLAVLCYCPYPSSSLSGSSYHQAFADVLFTMLCVPAWEMISRDMGHVLLLSVQKP